MAEHDMDSQELRAEQLEHDYSDLLYELNDAIGAVAAGYDLEFGDEQLNAAVHAAAAALLGTPDQESNPSLDPGERLRDEPVKWSGNNYVLVVPREDQHGEPVPVKVLGRTCRHSLTICETCINLGWHDDYVILFERTAARRRVTPAPHRARAVRCGSGATQPVSNPKYPGQPDNPKGSRHHDEVMPNVPLARSRR